MLLLKPGAFCSTRTYLYLSPLPLPFLSGSLSSSFLLLRGLYSHCVSLRVCYQSPSRVLCCHLSAWHGLFPALPCLVVQRVRQTVPLWSTQTSVERGTPDGWTISHSPIAFGPTTEQRVELNTEPLHHGTSRRVQTLTTPLGPRRADATSTH